MSSPPALLGISTAVFLGYAYFARTVCVHSRVQLSEQERKYKQITDRFFKGQSIPKTMREMEENEKKLKQLRQDVDDCKSIHFIYDFFKQRKN